MKKLVIHHTFDADIIVVPDKIADNCRLYQKKFDKWIYDKSIDHKYWIYKNGEKYGIGMCTEAFVEYLNNFHVKNPKEKVYVLEENIREFSEDLPILYF